MHVPPSCPRCGGPLPDLLAGLCPACLLQLVVADTDGTAPATTTDVSGRHTGGAHPDRIGPYRILEILGEGGMGIVYLAEQREPLRRNVAIKVIKLGMDTQGVVARFEAERQTLALMDHPNIASVFDAGTTGDGRPYVAMEYVAGVPITEYCDTARLSTRERLTLLTHVCGAIQHAHQKGVIHRDIKPSNVLVAVQDGQPTPKVIDFGIAKATERSVVERTLFTQHGQLVGTPEYMSPEQADRSRNDIDATTDIYSLGVVLYELLVGVLPFDPVLLREAGYNEMLRIVCEDEPPRPSARLSTLGATAPDVVSRRHTEIETLRRELRGDLDWIILRAMEKDRARRYASASVASISTVERLTVALWRVSDATQIATWATRALDPADLAQGAGNEIPSLSFSADERSLAVGYDDGRVEIRRVPSGALVRDFSAHTQPVSSMATSMDGRWLATGSHGRVRVWDWVTGVEQGMIDLGWKRTPVALAFRSDDVLVIGTWGLLEGNGAFLSDWQSNHTLSSVGVGSPVLDIAISPSNGRIALALAASNGRVPAVSIWDSGLSYEITRLVGAGRQAVVSVAYSPDGQRLVSAGEGLTRIWNAERFDLLAALDLGYLLRGAFHGRRPTAGGGRHLDHDTGLPSAGTPPVRRLVLNDGRSR